MEGRADPTGTALHTASGPCSSEFLVYERWHLYRLMKKCGFRRKMNDRIIFLYNELSHKCQLDNEFTKFANQLRQRWHNCRRDRKRFERRNKDWLNGTIFFRTVRADPSTTFEERGRNDHQNWDLPQLNIVDMAGTDGYNPAVFSEEEPADDVIFDEELETYDADLLDEPRSGFDAEEGQSDDGTLNVEYPVCIDLTDDSSDAGVPEQGVAGDNSEEPNFLYSCDLCDFTCLEAMDLNLHMITHQETNPCGFDQCDYNCREDCELQEHKTLHNLRPHCTCDQCSDCKTMVKHETAHDLLQPFSCENCNICCLECCELPINEPAEELHLCGLHDSEVLCERSSTSHQYRTSDSSEEPSPCYSSNYNIRRNKGCEYGAPSKKMLYECGRCHYRCTDETRFEKHTTSQAREGACEFGKYACNMCNFRCHYADSLKEHIMTHLSEEASFI